MRRFLLESFMMSPSRLQLPGNFVLVSLDFNFLPLSEFIERPNLNIYFDFIKLVSSKKISKLIFILLL